MKVAVIGAGPAGMSAAYKLAGNGVHVDVYEADSAVGGLAKTISLWNQNVDLGPHRFFSSDPRVNSLWLEVAAGDYEMVDRLTRIFYRKRFFHYPLRPYNVLSNLGIAEAAACLLSYGKEMARPTAQDGSFEAWVVNRFGRRLFNIFFKTYSEKLWGIPCRELDADFAAQRIKKFSLGEAIRSAFSRNGGGGHKTLVDQFAYPHGGSGMIYERMADSVKARGGNMNLGCPVAGVVPEGQRVTGITLRDGSFRPYDKVVSTMPIDLLVTGLPEAPSEVRELAAKLRFRNTILVYLHLDRENLFPDNWLYIHSPDLSTGRIVNFRNWVPHLYKEEKTTILGMEYWSNEREELWNSPDGSLADLAGREVRRTGLVVDARILDSRVVRMPRSYPVYDRGYRRRMGPIEEYLRRVEGLHAIGRCGSFKYNNQDHSILMGILAAENIAGSASHDLWEVNTDYEYQERALITKTGLAFR